ncbi:MAG: hypothetical protein ONB11_11465, partial [candidate division KSB1 bacterium]|nr:hypothetical protein [candidate division KSB1 bacterium]
MKIGKQILILVLMVLLVSSASYSQSAGDYRSAATGNWSSAATWETFDGTNWVSATIAPAGTENILVDGTDTVRVDVAVAISGHVKVIETGVLEVSTGSLTFGDSSSYEHARDAGALPTATWATGSTFLLTGTKQDAPANRNQNFGNVVFNTPNLGRNRDMGWDNITISGSVRVISSGSYRWQMTSAPASDTAQITILGDVIVEGGQFSVHGTSNALTTFIVDHFGHINVTGGNFSIARGSQGNGSGTTTWFLKEGDFSMANATTQNSNPTPGNAKFVFARAAGNQKLRLSNVTYGGGGLPIQVDSLATLDMDTTAIAGNGSFTLLPGATLVTAHPNGLDGNLKTTGPVTLSKQANFTFNGTVAQVTGTLLPDSVAILTVSNHEGISFDDTLRCVELMVTENGTMKVNAAGNVAADSGMVAGTIVNEGLLSSNLPLIFMDGSFYEHARNGGSVPSGIWQDGSTASFTGITSTAPDNRGQDYYNLVLNTPGLTSNRDLNLNGHTIGGTIRVINTGSARWQLVGGSSGTVTIMGDVIVEAGQLATQGTSSATDVVVDHYGNIDVQGGNFAISRGSQANGTGSTTWFLRQGNFSMANATTQNSNPTPGKAKFVFANHGSTQFLKLINVTYGGGGLPIQVDSLVTLNMDTTAIGGNGSFTLSDGATLVSAHPYGVDGNLQTTGTITFGKSANFMFNGTGVQAAGLLLPDTLGTLTVANPSGVAFSDTLTCQELLVAAGSIMTIDSLGNITANAGMVDGNVINKGHLEAITPIVFGSGSVYEHARNGGSIPLGQWNQDSMVLLTGIVNSAPANRNQSYYHLTINTPNLASNLDLGLNAVTIGGNIHVVNTGNSRWRLTSAPAGDTAIVHIAGDVIVEKGSFETQGTSNALTVFEVHHYGNVIVTGGNFSVARGSQGNGSGSTRWFLHGGDFSLANATTQNSNPTNARFVFDGPDSVQHIALDQVTYGGGGLAVEIATGTTVDFGLSELAGNGLFILNENATLATAHEAGVAGTLKTTGTITFNEGANYIFNGTNAQVTSTLMPAIVKDLVIDNEAGVKLSQPTTINGVLRLKAGEFDNTIPFALGPGGSISFEGGRLKVPTLVDQMAQTIPTEFALHQNYPNPFNPTTTIG